ncbi:SNAP receptor SNC1 [Saccharomyces cerevisiae]|nr:hypothetical protein FZC28_6955g5273 [Saccharomyces cerevisiae]KOH52522.1 SNC1p Vesicle membrane receptor protein (v-SNARE) [Saccharomyces boulardii (nom. inval.)]KAJ1049288.1 hypothetical protein FZC27_7997g4103 [Saccharomyces cerevisiae]KQC45729.1 Vesicle membrane receptor protein (v-SNARE) [Saccharomyces boulardii (nom. inval.)]PJP07569.1 SNAP receptor SNC1 [Saccharomyces cerevisiae]
MSSSTPFDPYALSEHDEERPQNVQSKSRTAELQAVSTESHREIDDTVGIMRDNINKVAERGERLTSIEDKADNLAVSAQGFKRGANRVRKAMWYKDLKMKMCLALVIIILLVVIIVPIAVHFSR